MFIPVMNLDEELWPPVWFFLKSGCDAAVGRAVGLSYLEGMGVTGKVFSMVIGWAGMGSLLDEVVNKVKDDEKTKEQFINELVKAHWRVAELETEKTERERAEEVLRRRDTILEAVSYAAERFLRASDWEQDIKKVLERLGRAAKVSRVYIFENRAGEDGTLSTSQVYEWTAPGIEPQIENPVLQSFAYQAGGVERWEATLARGGVISGHVREFPACEQEVLIQQNIKSIIVMPIFVGQEWWGFIGFDECLVEREWSVMETDALKAAAGILGAAIQRRRAEEEQRKITEKLLKATQETVYAMALMVEMRDSYTAGHQRRVARLARAIAEEMGLSEKEIEGAYLAAAVHDIGKICVPAEILCKPGRLLEIEFSMIKTHPRVGYDILKTVEFPWPVARIVLQHHERMDGSGYPSGLKYGDILLEARILGVADVVEAMASHRPYRPSCGIDNALEEISENRSILYDSEVVDACIKLFAKKGFMFG